jgi:uncharacterized protein (TIGR04255 family)
MNENLPPPLGSAPPAEVRLLRSPLVRVVAQVRFPGILKINNKESVALFQEEIRRAYPLFEQEIGQQLHIEMTPGAPIMRQDPNVVWRFLDAERNWRVTLGTDTVSLEAENYSSRDEFVSRLNNILGAMQLIFDPRIVLRVGLRYINRINADDLSLISDLVPPDILGIAKPPLGNYLQHFVAEAQLKIEEGDILLRWGRLPPGATFDPNLFQPTDQPSWIIDIDAFSSAQRLFVSSELAATFRGLAERSYAVFRYMVTPAFLKHHGGEL